MTDFEKTQIGFDVVWTIIFVLGLFGVATLAEISREAMYWLERDFKTKFGYTECWKI